AVAEASARDPGHEHEYRAHDRHDRGSGDSRQNQVDERRHQHGDEQADQVVPPELEITSVAAGVPVRMAPKTGYRGTAREARWAPTLRFTLWRALSTVFVSQSRYSPICS